MNPSFDARTAALCLLLAATLVAATPAAGDSGSSDRQRPSPEEAAQKAIEKAEKAIGKERYERAIRLLERARKKDPKNAEAENLLGYSHRQLGRFDEAFQHYEKALSLDPTHRGAHEYLGQAYLETDQPARAKEVLDKLAKLCPKGCPELESLAKAVGSAGSRAGY